MPFIGIGTPMIAVFLRLNYRTESLLQKLRRVDYFGMVVFIGSMTGFIIAITWGGVMYPWDHWRTLVPLIVCSCGLAVFVVHQEYFAPEPLIRTSVFKNRTAAVNYFQTAMHGIMLWGLLYYLPLYYEAVKGFTPILSGVALFPQTFTVAPAAMVTGVVISVRGTYRWASWGGWFFTTLGTGLLVLLKTDTPTVEWIWLNLIGGLGAGMLFPAMAITAQAAAPAKDQAYASTMFSFIRTVGQTLGVAIGGVIFQNQMKKKLLNIPAFAAQAGTYAKDASALVQIIKEMPEGPDKHNLKVAYADSLQYIWIVLCAFSAVAFFSSWFMQAYPLDRELETEQGYREKKKTRDEEAEHAAS